MALIDEKSVCGLLETLSRLTNVLASTLAIALDTASSILELQEKLQNDFCMTSNSVESSKPTDMEKLKS